MLRKILGYNENNKTGIYATGCNRTRLLVCTFITFHDNKQKKNMRKKKKQFTYTV